MKRICYVGHKVAKTDTVAGTLKEWVKAENTVHEVTDAEAEILLRHPDVWALAKDAAPAKVEKAKVEEKPKKKEEEEQYEVVNLATLTKEKLVNYAKRNFGKDLSLKNDRASLVKQVKTLQKAFDAGKA